MNIKSIYSYRYIKDIFYINMHKQANKWRFWQYRILHHALYIFFEKYITNVNKYTYINNIRI